MKITPLTPIPVLDTVEGCLSVLLPNLEYTVSEIREKKGWIYFTLREETRWKTQSHFWSVK